MSHAAQTTLLIEACLTEAQLTATNLDAVSLSKGPGSYTSLRVGASVAKGMCYALNIPLLTIDTLESLAEAAYRHTKDDEALYCAMIDARRMEVYCSIFDANRENIQAIDSHIVDENSFQNFFALGKKIIFTGNGAEKCKNIISSPLAHFLPLTCEAPFLISIANQKFIHSNFDDIAYFSPQYVKAPNITTAKNIF